MSVLKCITMLNSACISSRCYKMATRRTHGGSYFNSERGFMLCVTALVCLLPTVTSGVGYIQTTRMSWWEAREHCREDYNSDLFIPQLKVNTSNMETDTVYWIGALETAQWQWTDGTPLFKHAGYIPRTDNADYDNLPGNSILECYRHCNMNQYIGLRQTRCYCLYGHFTQQYFSNVTLPIPCPGSPEEICGKINWISVYELEVPFDIENVHDRCAVARKVFDFSNGWYITLQTEDCAHEKHSICEKESQTRCKRIEDSVCVTRHEADWSAANQSYKLEKVSNSNTVILRSLFRFGEEYWVGLYKTFQRNWNNGTEVLFQFRSFQKSDQNCLAFYNGINKILTAFWIPCKDKHKSLCSQKEQSTNVNTSAEFTSKNPGRTKPPTSPSPDILTSPATNLKATPKRQLDSTDKVENNKLIIYLGVCIGCLLVTLALFGITVVLLKRQKLLCFQKTQKKAVRFNTATENRTYETDTNLGTIPTSTFPSQQTTATLADKKNYENVENGLPQSTTLNRDAGYVSPKKSSGQINAEKRENIDDYDTTSPKKSFEDTNHCYSRLGGGNDDVYDTAGTHTEGNTRNSTYNHVDSTNIQDEGINKEESLIGNEGKTVDYYNMQSTASGGYKNTNFSSNEQDGSFAVNEECKDVYTLAKAI